MIPGEARKQGLLHMLDPVTYPTPTIPVVTTEPAAEPAVSMDVVRATMVNVMRAHKGWMKRGEVMREVAKVCNTPQPSKTPVRVKRVFDAHQNPLAPNPLRALGWSLVKRGTGYWDLEKLEVGASST